MRALERLQQMICKLSPEELAELRAWLSAQDWIETDRGEAPEDQEPGRTRPL